ncbi:MAG: hypothetical protein H8E20_03220 [Verrucomicrobia bacterium]|nr:hypothetical protein [Verrucomicrobiota bacterium]
MFRVRPDWFHLGKETVRDGSHLFLKRDGLFGIWVELFLERDVLNHNKKSPFHNRDNTYHNQNDSFHEWDGFFHEWDGFFREREKPFVYGNDGSRLSSVI